MFASGAPHAPKPARAPIGLLMAIAAVSPLGINMYLPSMPTMARTFGVDFATAQLTLSLYLCMIAVAQLVVGGLSDRLGRRPVLLAGLSMFVLGSLMCAVAPSIEIMIAGRLVQAIGGCAGLVLSRAIVRDLYDRSRAASVMSYVTMGMAVAPMIAPTIGGLLDTFYSWRASFIFMAGFAAMVVALSATLMTETHHTRGGTMSVGTVVRSYGTLLMSGPFLVYTLILALTAGMFFSFVGGAPFVMIELMDRTPAEYGLYFALVSLGYILGSFVSGRFVTRIGVDRIIMIGCVGALASVGLMGVALAAGLFHPIGLFGPMLLVGVSNGLVMPNAAAGAVSVRPDIAGAASGLAGSLQIAFGALMTHLVASALGDSVWPMVAMMAICGVLTVVLFAVFLAGRPRSRL